MTSSLHIRPQILPGLPILWRDLRTAQIGLDGPRSTILTGLQQGDDRILAALDGSQSRSELLVLAADCGAAPDRVDHLLRLLGQAQVLVDHGTHGPTTSAELQLLGRDQVQALRGDAQAWALTYPQAGDGVPLLAARTRRRVQIDGAGRLPSAIAGTLADAGVGILGPASNGPADRNSARPDLVVMVRKDLIDTLSYDKLVQERLPHLAVVGAINTVTIGPLVIPGHTPCLRCLDLHRRDRDPCWPQVAAQLTAQHPSRESGELALTTTAAGLACLQVLNFLDGQVCPATIGRTLTVSLPDGLPKARRWPGHPGCGCLLATSATPGDSP